MKKIVSLLLVVLMLTAALAACGEKAPAEQTTADPAGTTAAPADDTTAAPADDTTAAPADDTTAAPVVTTEAPAETTEAEEEFNFGENEYGTLDDAEKLKLLDVIPALLPDGTPIEKWVRPYCLDDVLDKDGYQTHYYLDGKSSPYATLVDTDNGAVYGTAIKMNAHGQTPGGDRAEIAVHTYYDANVKGAKGILFYVDFSHTNTNNNPDKPLVASVTINTNKVRSNKDDNGSVGYYFRDGVWTETKNVNACRMELPDGFAGWIYVPATSYQQTSDKTPVVDEKGCFIDIPVENMRLYTDGYEYSTDGSCYVIFDEILYIY